MEFIPLVVIAVVLLTGIVALAMGYRGWHPANTTGAWLVLLASCGFLALAGIRGQSERAWATMLRGWESRVLEVRDAVRADPRGKAGLEPLGECSLDTLQNCPIATLEQKQLEWSRALERVNSWRGRFWSNVTFVPPAVKKAEGEVTPGRITIAEPEKPSIAEGAELYLFDAKPLGEGGKFIGGFRVTQVNDNQLQVLPFGPVETRDIETWNAAHDEVVAYENLPFDRWIAFHRTGRDAEATVIPEPRKRLPDDGPLRDDLERHDFPEELLSPAGEDGTNPFPEDPDAPPPGVDWATLEFEADFTWKPENSDGPEAPIEFKAGEKVSAFPARDVAALRKAGAAFKHAWSVPPGLFWAEVEFGEGYIHERGDADPIEFSSGDVVRLPLEDAEKLAKDGKLTIKRRLYRRPLNAADAALRGAAAVDREGRPTADAAEGGVAIDSIGIFRMTEMLRRRIQDLDRNTQEVVEAHEASKRQLTDLEGLKDRLAKDLGNWSSDVDSAEQFEKEAAMRFEAARKTLETSERAIVELGTALRKITSTLATEVDRRAPPPASRLPPGS